MKECGLRSVALIVAVFLLWAVIPVFAAESGTACDSGVDSGPVDTASSFAEMQDWLETYKGQTRTLRLTQDIVVDTYYRFLTRYDDGRGTLTVDTGANTIYVRGALELYPLLKIVGQGGEKGVFRVEPGGILYLSDVSVQASDGYTVWQEEGSGVYLNPAPESVHYADTAAALPDSSLNPQYTPVAILDDGAKDWKAALPKTVSSSFYQNEKLTYEEQLPVKWDVDACAEKFAEEKRFYLTGKYTGGVATLEAPRCLVVFRKAPSVFLYCWCRSVLSGNTNAYLRFTKPEEDINYEIECSMDGESAWWPADGDGACYVEESRDGVMVISYLIPSGQERWFRLRFNDGGKEIYSEVVGTRDGEMVSLDREGSRGGGTELDVPPVAETVYGGENANGGAEKHRIFRENRRMGDEEQLPDFPPKEETMENPAQMDVQTRPDRGSVSAPGVAGTSGSAASAFPGSVGDAAEPHSSEEPPLRETAAPAVPAMLPVTDKTPHDGSIAKAGQVVLGWTLTAGTVLSGGLLYHAAPGIARTFRKRGRGKK